MEDGQLPITVGQGAGARVVTLELPPFTLDRRDHARRPADHAAARPLRHPAPARALRRAATSRGSCCAPPALLGIEIDARPAPARSPSAPAARRAWPTACSSACATTPRSTAAGRDRRRGGPAALDLLEVDERGPRPPRPRDPARALREVLRRPGRALARSPSRWGRSADTIEDVYEPYLLQRGLLERTPARARAPPRAGLRRTSGSSRAGARRRPCSADRTSPSTLGPRDGAPLHLPQLRQPHAPRPTGRPASAASRRAARSAASASSSSCSTTTTPRPTRPSSSATRRAASSAAAAAPSSSPASTTRTRHRPPGARGPRPRLRGRARTRSGPCSSGASAARQAASTVNAEGDLPAQAVADLFPAYDDDGGTAARAHAAKKSASEADLVTPDDSAATASILLLVLGLLAGVGAW